MSLGRYAARAIWHGLARFLGDVLRWTRNRVESFVVERDGVPVANRPIRPGDAPRLRDVVAAWRSIDADPQFADDLERVGAADAPARGLHL